MKPAFLPNSVAPRCEMAPVVFGMHERYAHFTSRDPAWEAVGTRFRVIRRGTSKKPGSAIFDLSLYVGLSRLLLVSSGSRRSVPLCTSSKPVAHCVGQRLEPSLTLLFPTGLIPPIAARRSQPSPSASHPQKSARRVSLHPASSENLLPDG